MSMKRITLLLGFFIITSTTLRAEPELKGSPAELALVIAAIPKAVQVGGESEIRIPASRAVVNLVVVTESKSLQEALRLNAEARSKATTELKQAGIPLEKIQASRFSSTPKFGMWSDKAKSYRVENTLRISIQDEKEFRGVAKVVDTIAEANFAGVEFEYTDQEAIKAKAIAQACDNAESRKKIYEEQLKIKLTPSRFTEGSVTEKESAPMPHKSEYDSSMARMYSSSIQESVSSFGEMIFTAKVTVEYQVDAK